METKMRELELLKEYVQDLYMEEHTKRTIEKYRRDVQVFLNALPCGQEIGKEQVIAWKTELQQNGYAVATINSMLAAVNGFLRFTKRENCCVKPLKQQRKIFRDKEKELSQEEYRSLLKAAKQKNQHRLMLVMETICATGIRVSELEYITVEAAQKGKAVVNCKNKSRVIIIPEKLCRKLLAYSAKKMVRQGTVFLSRNGKPLNRSNIWADMKKLCERAGVDRTKVFPHNLRHLFARVFYRFEKDIAKLADVLGHSSIETTRIYIMESGMEHARMIEKMGLII